MLSQKDLFDLVIKLYGSLKVISRYLEVSEELLSDYYDGKTELPLSLYEKIHHMVQREFDSHFIGVLQSDDPDFMTLKRTRQRLGLSLESMAKILGLHGRDATEALTLMEDGDFPPIGPINQILRYLHQPITSEASGLLSKYMICRSLDTGHDSFHILYTGHPRFLAIPVDRDRVCDSIAAVPLDESQSLIVGMWIDAPVAFNHRQIKDILSRAVKYLKLHDRAVNMQAG
jgi:transcriptional regulator with XRE-family HTH domain